MIYVDPPYGVKYSSNFQIEVGNRDMKEDPKSLTREAEMIRAYRDTWTLGVHSYLAYLRDRLFLAKSLLADSGSIFVQIGDAQLHRVRAVLDEVFGTENFCALIGFKKTGSQASGLLASVYDFLLWYARDIDRVKYRPVYLSKLALGDGKSQFRLAESEDGEIVPIDDLAPEDSRRYRVLGHDNLTSQGLTTSSSSSYGFEGRRFTPPANSHWKTPPTGLDRLAKAGRLMAVGNTLRFKRYLDDFSISGMANIWDDTAVSGFSEKKAYVVQTIPKVIERCVLMTTDPGDLVVDPTSGGGTTAFVAEEWGRRWIAIDTSRVANTITRQRLLTATYPFFELRDEDEGVNGGFNLKAVPHIRLKDIANSTALDAAFAKHSVLVAERLEKLNAELTRMTLEIRNELRKQLIDKERSAGRRAVTEADRRRWLLPAERWEEWNVPFDSDPKWPEPLREALDAYRSAWRAKMDEVNSTIAASADQEPLVDQPQVVKGIVRVSGPFTVESVLPPEAVLDDEPGPIEAFDGELDTFQANGAAESDIALDPQNQEAFIERMIRLLRQDGARFFDNKQVKFARLDPLENEILHAEGEWQLGEGEPRRVAVSVGPQSGSVTAKQVEECLRAAYRRGFDDVVFAGFGFDAAAQAAIQEDANPTVRAHLAQIRPDVTMGDLLKETANSQIFTILGLPRTRLERRSDGEFSVVMEGVDIYLPVENRVESTSMDKVAAWFVDSDYDGRTFCICQAFFPDRTAWDKIAKALKGVIEPEAFEQLSGTVSLPFRAGPHGRVAVKVIDPRGSEVMAIHDLSPVTSYAASMREDARW